MTPFQNPITEAQQRYNNAHTGTRIGIEQLFGQWKRRFMILHNEIRVPQDRVSSVISACAVLHNIAQLPDIFDDPMEFVQPPMHVYVGNENVNAFKVAFANTHFGAEHH